MKDFEEWLDQSKSEFDDDVVGLFTDSIRCYKSNITRPAYLLAYQGLMQHIRLLMLKSAVPPTGITPIDWQTNYTNHLQDEEQWDKETFKCVQQGANGGGTKILSIPKMAREKWEFWRQCRNVCAHYKSFDLNQAHTMALYSFIEQYIFQVFVEGSQSSLLREFDIFYDPSYTSPNADIEPLLLKIDKMVEEKELLIFLNEIQKLCNKHALFTDRFIDTISVAFQKCPLKVRKACQEYLQKDDDLMRRYLEKYPNDVLEVISSEGKSIHKFWYDVLPTYRSKLTVLALLQESGLIPEADIPGANNRCITYSYQHNAYGYYSPICQEHIDILEKNGYFSEFYKEYFNSEYSKSHYQDMNYKMDFLASHVEILPKDKKYVQSIISIFTQDYKPYALGNMLRDKYQNDPTYKAKIDQICKEEGLALPQCLL